VFGAKFFHTHTPAQWETRITRSPENSATTWQSQQLDGQKVPSKKENTTNNLLLSTFAVVDIFLSNRTAGEKSARQRRKNFPAFQMPRARSNGKKKEGQN